MTAETPSVPPWGPGAILNQGGGYAFNGSQTAVDGTFVFDFTDLLSTSGSALHYYLGMSDNLASDAASLTAFKIKDLVSHTEAMYSGPDLILDNAQDYVYVTHTYSGETANHAPVLSGTQVSMPAGPLGTRFAFLAFYTDEDGDAPSAKDVVIDDVTYALTLISGTPELGLYSDETDALAVGTHNYRYHFEDGRGGVANAPAGGTFSGPIVTLQHNVGQPTTPTGETAIAIAGTVYSFSTGGSTCSADDDVEYQFDWGDGATSGWLSRADECPARLVQWGILCDKGPSPLRSRQRGSIPAVGPDHCHGSLRDSF